MTFLRSWGLVIVVTLWLLSFLLGFAVILTTGLCIGPALFAGRVYIQEMREWRLYGHPRNRRVG